MMQNETIIFSKDSFFKAIMFNDSKLKSGVMHVTFKKPQSYILQKKLESYILQKKLFSRGYGISRNHLESSIKFVF